MLAGGSANELREIRKMSVEDFLSKLYIFVNNLQAEASTHLNRGK